MSKRWPINSSNNFIRADDSEVRIVDRQTNFKLENNYPPKSDRVDQLAEGLVVSVKQVADRAAVALEKTTDIDLTNSALAWPLSDWEWRL